MLILSHVIYSHARSCYDAPNDTCPTTGPARQAITFPLSPEETLRALRDYADDGD